LCPNLSIVFSFTLLFSGVFLVGTLSLLLPLPSMANPQAIIPAAPIDEDYEEMGNEENDDEDFEQENSILICCAWGYALADGSLTYYINDKDSSEKQQEVVRDAIKEWDKKIDPLELEESSNQKVSDIKIDFQKDNEQGIAGQTVNTFDSYGLTEKVGITIFKETSDYKFNNVVIKQIAIHEMGHALGLGHANFNGNIMAALINYGTDSISECEVRGVFEANHWYMEDNDDGNNIPEYPRYDIIACDR
jgi:predicted Zn-dependent protease